MKRNFTLLTLLALVLTFVGCGGQTKNKAQDGENYVVILSMDAFRHDLADFYDTPTLDSIAKVGVFSEIMPCFPSNTFPNHYAMATGLHPDHHGIVNNSFYAKELGKRYSIGDAEARVNADFYKGEPIWNTVERQGQVAHVYTWVGVEAPINDHFPTEYVLYDVNRSRRELADLVLGA
ncbi:MAG: alkaline phosphatase family protein, partial [Tidjanibacter sp.]|nr:alkaline phosphatase family protein [Tidjanibacter sp.]